MQTWQNDGVPEHNISYIKSPNNVPEQNMSDVQSPHDVPEQNISDGKSLNNVPEQDITNEKSSCGDQDGKQTPQCTRCRNHYIFSKWKGHKNQCKYKNCVCEKCIFVSMRKKLRERKNGLHKEVTLEDIGNTTFYFLIVKDR